MADPTRAEMAEPVPYWVRRGMAGWCHPQSDGPSDAPRASWRHAAGAGQGWGWG